MSWGTRRQNEARTVYFIRPVGMRGPIKIGCSASPEKRRGSLETWCPFALEIIAEIPANFLIERRFHALFWEYHERREWFRWAPLFDQVVDSINAGAFDVSTLPAEQRLKSPACQKSPNQRRQTGISLRAGYAYRNTGYRPPVSYRDVVRRGDEEAIRLIEAWIRAPHTGVPESGDWAAAKRKAYHANLPAQAAA